MWGLIFLFFNFMNIMGSIYPFLMKMDVRLNILRLKGAIQFTIFNKFKIEFKFRIKTFYSDLFLPTMKYITSILIESCPHHEKNQKT